MFRSHVHLLSVLWLLLCCAYTWALDPVTRFDRLSYEDGLSQSVVTTIIEDGNGFLWFGTEDGLNRYDGYGFKVFRHDPERTSTLSHNFIQSLYVDDADVLWVGTNGGGLNRYDADTERFVHYQHDPQDPHSLSHNNVQIISGSAACGLWVGTRKGLDCFDRVTGHFKHYQHRDDDPHSLSGNNVQTLLNDSQGRLWVGTNNGLNQLDLGQDQFSHYFHYPLDPHSISHNNIQSLHQDPNGRIWVGTRNGLNRIEGLADNPTVVSFSQFQHQADQNDSLSHNDVRSLYGDRSGALWVATYGGGLNRYDGALEDVRFKHFNNQASELNSLSSDLVLSIYQDSQQGLWFGTVGGGLSTINSHRQHFGYFKYNRLDPNSFGHNMVLALYKDVDETVWIGTSDGLYKSEQDEFIHFNNSKSDPHSLSQDMVYSVYRDSKGVLWVGTGAGGLNRFNPFNQSFDHFRHRPTVARSLSHDNITRIFEDSQARLWIGTWGGGLDLYDPKGEDFSHFILDPNNQYSISENAISALAEQSSKVLWVGTYGGGLNRFATDTHQFIAYQHQATDPNSLSHNNVLALYYDPRGTLWVGTEGGLNKFDSETGKFKRYREKEGLANDVVYGILDDEQGTLWLSTNQGLSRFDPSTETFRNYDVNDGLQSNEFNDGAFFKSADGELFFGGINGFNRFFSANIKEDTSLPKVVLTDLLLSNHPVPIEDPTAQHSGAEPFSLAKVIDKLELLTFDYHQNLISFEFAALHFANAAKNRYAYQLIGQDQDWIYTDANHRRATYTNLAAGDYVLRVKASNHHGYWNEQGKSLKITITPPPWKTWWAYLIYTVMLTLPIFAYFHWQQLKIRQEHQLNLRLELKVSQRTAELVQKNQEVELKSQQMVQQNREIIAAQQQLIQYEKMASLGTLTAGVAHEINNPTNYIQVSSHNLAVDLADLKSFLFALAGENPEQSVLTSIASRFEPLYLHLRTINDGTSRIKSIVQDLRVFSQLDAAEQKTVVITELLQSTVNLVQTQYLEVTTFSLDFQVRPQLFCYPAQLNQVFMNLIVNACHAIKTRQQQDPSKGLITISCQSVKDLVAISIEDNGCGMTAETMSKLFEPFFTTKDVGEGTGLGLAISYGIIKKHGGELNVRSELGVGSVFTILL